ncbi:MAG: hypothetical protein HC835_15260 [Oscillatoriales cyanobacterium RM2_1_1]|nr:hypothetical protein [Oscillatoriales cyanobacterium SM2_3_0]NJO46866.1 hypothetical protein [Oscillatoriales cyanobacterium RM2_1_1]
MENAASYDSITPEYPIAGYAPSVPISLYREVTADLQSSKSIADSLKDQNRQLLQQNQQLRQELENVTQAAIKLQQAINSAQSVSPSNPSPVQFLASLPSPNLAGSNLPNLSSKAPAPSVISSNISSNNLSNNLSRSVPAALVATAPEVQPEAKVKAGNSPPAQPELPFSSPTPKPPEVPEILHSEEAGDRYRPSKNQTNQGEMSGFWLAVSIALIMIFAFGAGYLFVRPWIQKR